MSQKYQWYFCNLALVIFALTSCSAPAAGLVGAKGTPTAEAAPTATVTPTIIPRSGDLIFVEFFAVT